MIDFLEFLNKSRDAYSACNTIEEELINLGYIKLEENKEWNLEDNLKYYVVRDDSSIIAFSIPKNIKDSNLGFNICASHLDSPTFKLKPNFDFNKSGYGMLNCEVYGGAIYNSWFDRPLGISGRIIYRTENGIKSMLVNLDKPMAIICNAPIHYRPELNTGVKNNPQVDLLPLFKDKDSNVCLYSIIAKKYGLQKENIISSDLFLNVLDRGMIAGADESLIVAPQLDDLICAYAMLASLDNKPEAKNRINVEVFFNNEEIGSQTINGASSDFLENTLERISLSLGYNMQEHKINLSNSFYDLN